LELRRHWYEGFSKEDLILLVNETRLDMHSYDHLKGELLSLPLWQELREAVLKEVEAEKLTSAEAYLWFEQEKVVRMTKAGAGQRQFSTKSEFEAEYLNPFAEEILSQIQFLLSEFDPVTSFEMAVELYRLISLTSDNLEKY